MSWRVLYVDDEADLREVAQMSLELDPDLEVRCCSNGRDAIEAVLAWRPDLVLLDMMMPGMDGETTFRRICEATGSAAPPIAFITARASVSDKAKFLELGAKGVIAKPFDPMRLASEIRQYLPTLSRDGLH